MLLSDLPDIVRRAKTLGFTDVTLETNATVASLPGRAQRLVESGVNRVLWSLNAPSEDANAAVYGFPSSHASSLEGIRAFIRAGANVIARTPLSRTNLPSLAEIPEWLRRHLPEIETWWLRPIKRSRDAPFPGTELPSLDALAETLPPALTNAQRLGLEGRIEDELGLPFCVFRGSPNLVKFLDQRARAKEGSSHIHGANCARCSVATQCPGQPLDYVNVFGEFDVKHFERTYRPLHNVRLGRSVSRTTRPDTLTRKPLDHRSPFESSCHATKHARFVSWIVQAQAPPQKPSSRRSMTPLPLALIGYHSRVASQRSIRNSPNTHSEPANWRYLASRFKPMHCD